MARDEFLLFVEAPTWQLVLYFERRFRSFLNLLLTTSSLLFRLSLTTLRERIGEERLSAVNQPVRVACSSWICRCNTSCLHYSHVNHTLHLRATPLLLVAISLCSVFRPEQICNTASSNKWLCLFFILTPITCLEVSIPIRSCAALTPTLLAQAASVPLST